MNTTLSGFSEATHSQQAANQPVPHKGNATTFERLLLSSEKPSGVFTGAKEEDFEASTCTATHYLNRKDFEQTQSSCCNASRHTGGFTEWLTASEAAHYLKVKPRTLTSWAREGKVPAHTICGVERRVWRFLRHELDAMLSTSSAAPADRRQQ